MQKGGLSWGRILFRPGINFRHGSLAGARFCGGCGHAIAAPAPIADRFASPDAYTPPDLAEKIRTARAVEGERKHLETAVRMLRAMDMRHWLPGAETALASLGGVRS